MMITKQMLFFFVTAGICLCVGCGKNSKVQKTKKAVLAVEKKTTSNDEKMRNGKDDFLSDFLKHPKTNFVSLPNYEGGPGRPRPNYLNYYIIKNHYPSYLCCKFSVEEMPYDKSKELERFKVSLGQIRELGQKKFPPLKWIAVAIRNVAGYKDASSFNKSFKVAAIFSADDVFNPSKDLSQLIEKAKTDRKPIIYDKTQPTPGEQQRWLIVEKHAQTQSKKTD